MAVFASPPYHRPDFTLFAPDAPPTVTITDQKVQRWFERAEVLDGSVRFNTKNPLKLEPALNRALFLRMVGLSSIEASKLMDGSRNHATTSRVALINHLGARSMAHAVTIAFQKRALIVEEPITITRPLFDLEYVILAHLSRGDTKDIIATYTGTSPELVTRLSSVMNGRLSVASTNTTAPSAVLVGHMAGIL